MSSGECNGATCPVEGGYFSYEPSQAGNGILLGCFIILIPLSTFFGIRYRTTMYSACLMTGLVLEVLCYVGRLLIHGSPRQSNYFVIYLLGSSVAPTFITAAIFYVLPRVMTIYDNDLVDVRPRYLNFLFFAIALLTIALQAVGSVFAAVGNSDVEIEQGLRILAAGFGVHLGSLALFFIVYFWFLQKKHRRAGRLNPENAYVYESSKFRLFLFGWQLAAWFIFIRTVYRLVETLSGLGSSLSQTEAAFMVLDGAQVAVASIILTALHPGKAFGKTWSSEKHGRQNGGASSPGVAGYDGMHDPSNRWSYTNRRRSYSPRRAPVPAELPLAYSNKYPIHSQPSGGGANGYYSPTGTTQISPAHTPPGFSPTRYQDSPKYSPKFSPTSASGTAPPTATVSTSGKHTNRFSMKSSKSSRSGGASGSTHDPPKRSPRQVQTQSNLVSSDDLW